MNTNPLRVNVISESMFTVQGHGVHTAFEEHVASLRKLPDVKVSVNSRKPADIVHIHTVGIYALRFLLFSRGLKVISAHVVPDSFVGSLRGARYWHGLAKWYLRWFYNRANGVFAVSHEVVDELKAMGVRKPIFLVPNTIDTSMYHAKSDQQTKSRQKLGIADDVFVVVCNGQVQPRKRVDSFMAAAKQLPNMKFVWVGGMPFKQLAANHNQMQKLIDHHPSNVEFTGVVDHKKVFDYYWAADLFFLPSEQETFGIVIVEAAAAGLPILLRDNAQYRQTFDHWYASAKNDHEFVAQIEKFASNKDYYHTMKQQAAHIAARYDSHRSAKQILGYYQELIEKKS